MKLFGLKVRRLTGRSVAKFFKVERTVARVNVYLHSPTLTETRTPREVCRRCKKDATLPCLSFRELREHFVMGSDEGRQQREVRGLGSFLENKSIK